MSTKKKILIGAAITGAVIGAAILASKWGGGGGGGSGLATTSAANTELLLFGGRNHKVFLGCLNCSEYDSGSVFNRYGDHGSRYSDASIFNPYGDYGSRYSSYSACSRYADDPPIVVDRQGNAYGRLTINPLAYQIRDPQIIAWLSGVCAGN